MEKHTNKYNALIDGLTRERAVSEMSLLIHQVRKGTLPPGYRLPPPLQKLLATLKDEEVKQLAFVVQQSYSDGMKAVLTYLSEEIDSQELRLFVGEDCLPVRPRGYSLQEDWNNRIDGVGWPEDEE